MFFEFGRGYNVGRTLIRFSASPYIRDELASGLHFYFGLLLLFARWLPICKLRCGCDVSLISSRLVTAVGHEQGV